MAALPTSNEIDELFHALNDALVKQVMAQGDWEWDLNDIRRATNMARSVFQDEFAAARKREGETDYLYLVVCY